MRAAAVLGVLVLAGVLVSLAACVVYRRAWAGWALVGFSALWLPANSGRLEGPLLLELTNTNGITAADLIGLAGVALGTFFLLGLEWRRHRGFDLAAMSRVVAICAIVSSVGALVAFFGP